MTGYARLPGAGYEALHPELKGVNPEDYPDINKLSILAEVAPYSREYNLYRQKVSSAARGNTELEIELGKIVDRVRQTKESSITMDNRRFTAPVEEIEGTVEAGIRPGLSVLPEAKNLARGRGRAGPGPDALRKRSSGRSVDGMCPLCLLRSSGHNPAHAGAAGSPVAGWLPADSEPLRSPVSQVGEPRSPYAVSVFKVGRR
jgi:hypothetical protein